MIYFYTLAGRPDKAIELTPGNHGNPGNVGFYYRWLAEQRGGASPFGAWMFIKP